MEHEKKNGKSWKPLTELVKPFYEFYKEDMPLTEHFFQEIETWRDIVLNHDTPPSNVKKTLKAYQFSGLENVKTSLKILGTIPMTWCECERSFSGMRRLVNFCRTTIKWTPADEFPFRSYS